MLLIAQLLIQVGIYPICYKKLSSFKYTKIFKYLIHARHFNIIRRNIWIFCNDFWSCKISTKSQGESTSGFFRWKSDYGEHSKAIGKIIHEGWKKGSTLYASAEYIDGTLQYHEPKDPDLQNFGLARGHLINGYPKIWGLYKTVRAESVSICNEIKSNIESCEKIVFDEVDKEIRTNKGKRKLERKTDGQVFSIELGQIIYPRKPVNSLYLYRRILQEIIQEANNRNNNEKEKQEVWITESVGIRDLRIGDRTSSVYTTIGLGDGEMMEELKRRIEKMLEDSAIRKLVRGYHDKKSQLESREKANQLDIEINHMWNEIKSQNAFLKGEGSCQNSDKCRPKPKSSEEVYYAP